MCALVEPWKWDWERSWWQLAFFYLPPRGSGVGNFWLSTFYAVFLHLCPLLPFLFLPFLRLFFFDWFSLRPQPVGAALVPACVRNLVASQICVCEGGSPAECRLASDCDWASPDHIWIVFLPTDFFSPGDDIWGLLTRPPAPRWFAHSCLEQLFCHLSMYFVSMIRPPPTLGFYTFHETKPRSHWVSQGFFYIG